MDGVSKALRVSAPTLLDLPNVVGFGRGYKQVDGKNTGKLAVTVLVTKKVPKGQLRKDTVVPKSIALADTDVIEVGEVVALSRLEKMRPARPGSSIGHYKITAGTFGAVVYDSKTGEPLILSNNHVLANSSSGKDGRAAVGDPILQPGRYDDGKDADVIARLHRFVPISLEMGVPECKVAAAFERTLNSIIRRFRKNYCLKVYNIQATSNLVDAAVAKPLAPDMIADDIIDLGVPKGIAEAEVGDKVSKSGRTSGTNHGEVKVVQATVKVNMGDVGTAVFADQCVTTHMAQPGDSGSVVMNTKGEVVGLLSAGSDTISIFARAKNVCEALGISFTKVR